MTDCDLEIDVRYFGLWCAIMDSDMDFKVCHHEIQGMPSWTCVDTLCCVSSRVAFARQESSIDKFQIWPTPTVILKLSSRGFVHLWSVGPSVGPSVGLLVYPSVCGD